MTTAELARILRAGARHTSELPVGWPARNHLTMTELGRLLGVMAEEADKITQEKGE